MDERRLADLFQDAADDAASEAPPATFDHADVLAGSRRAVLRQRRRVAGGAAVAVVALAAVGLAGSGVLGSPAGSSSTLAGPAPASAPARPGFAPEARSEGPPEAAPYGAAASSGARQAPAPPRPLPATPATPFGAQKRDSSAGCASPDPELFAQLAAVLPAVKGAAARPPAGAAGCPAGGRGFEVDVDDAGARGTLRVVVAPAGASPHPAAAP
ncbi:MAG: hypothetical protein J2P19_23470, partial [Pseudonocardia sp.]|nr:hypothetical protein [Pseudonocardia sp.]